MAVLHIPLRTLANTIENQITSDASGTSSITGTTNWTPATAVAPINPLASTYDYVTAVTALRTPSGTGNYTVYANSLAINSGGRLGFKGSGLLTIPNLILNGGQIENNATGGNPDTAQLAGSINLAGNSTLTPNGSGTTLNIFSTITNSAGVSATLTMQNGGTVLLSAQNTFQGNLTVANTSPGTILQLGINNALPATATVTLSGGANASPLLDLNGYSTTISNLTFTSGIFPGSVTNTAPGTTGTLTLGYNNATETLANGSIADNPGAAGTVALAKIGAGTLTLGRAYNYSGATTVSGGTLALTSAGSISNSASINIGAGGTFDVSAISNYTFGGDTTLGASGTGTTVGISAAAIKGASGGTVSLGSKPITLTYDGSHPALYISQGTLALNGNAFTLVNTAPLAVGAYTLIQQASGNIASSGSYSVSGTAIGAGTISVNGGNVNLTVTEISSLASLSFTNVGSLTHPVTVLNWLSNVTNATSFVILRSTDGGAFVQIGTAGANATTFTDENVAPNSAYVYTVQAFNGSASPGAAVSLSVPAVALSVDQRRQQFLTALASVTPPVGDLKTEFPYQLARMLQNPMNSTTFSNAQDRSDVLMQMDVASTNTDPFEIHAAMHGYLLASNLYTADMIAETKQLVALPNYDTNGSYVSENYYFMYNGSGFLACEQWPSFTDAGGKTGPVLKAAFKSQLLKYFDRVVKTNLWEHGSPAYVACDLSPIRMLAEFAQDTEVRQKAWDTLDWLMLDVACDWNQGYYSTAAARCKGWDVGLNASPDNPGTTAADGGLYYGGFRPITSFTDGNGEINHAFWMAYFGQYETPPIFQRIAGARFTSFRHRSAAWMTYNTTDTDYKYTWHTTNYSLASEYTFAASTSATPTFFKERQPVVFKWLSDSPESTLILGMENQASFYPPYANTTDYVPAPNALGYGMNPYSQHFQIQQTVIGVANVSPWYASQNGNETNASVIATLDPLYYADFYVPLTEQGAIEATAVTNGWVFCHGGTTLFGLWTYATIFFGPDVDGVHMLHSKGLQNAWVFETASVDEYPAATNVAAQLGAFEADVLAHGILVTNNMSAVLPQLQYTSIHGYTMKLIWRPCQTDNYWTVPPRFPAAKGWNTGSDYVYASQAQSNGVAINYTRATWPLLENPWMNQPVGGTNLTMTIDGYACAYTFPSNSANWGHPPAMSDVETLVAIAGWTNVVPFTVSDNQNAVTLVTNTVTSSNPALLPLSSLALAGTGTNRTLTITPPAGQSGTATLTLTAVNPQGASYSQPVSVIVTVSKLHQPLLSISAVTNNQITFQISGDAGPDYTVQTSTNLTAWTNLFTTNSPVLPFNWTDTGWQASPQKFYRIKLGP